MNDSNEMIKAMLGTSTANPASGNMQSNPAMKNIATSGKLIIEKIGEITKSVANLNAKWGG